MSRLEELIQKLCPDGVEYMPFGKMAKIVRGASPRPIKKFITTDADGVNWIKIGDVEPGSKYITATAEKITPDGAKKSRFVKEGDFILSNSMSFGRPYIMKTRGCIHDGWLAISDFDNYYISDFLYHLLNSNRYQQMMRQKASFGGAVQNLNADIVRELDMPVVALEIQREIVRILDNFTGLTVELTEKLTAELTARKKQYEYYRDKLLSLSSFANTKGCTYSTIGQSCDVISGFPFDSSQFSLMGVRLMRGMNVKRGFLDFSEENNRYWETATGLEKYLLQENDIIIAMDGSLVGKSFGIVTKEHLPLLLVQRVARIRSDSINSRYLYHWIVKYLPEYADSKKTAGAVPHISLKDIKSLPLVIPPSAIQEKLAYTLDRFDALCNDLTSSLSSEIEARQKQYEYYRDKLLSFKERIHEPL